MKPSSSRPAGTASPEKPLLETTSYRIEESDDLFGAVRELVNGEHPGLLATVDGDGVPRMRWMASLSCDFFPYLYTLTSPTSRKVAQLQGHPEVSWMFFNADLSLVVTLTGRAEVVRDARTIKDVWNHVRDKKHAYFLKNCTEGPGCAVIRTTVERMECTTPRNAMRFEVSAESVLPPRRGAEQP